MTKVANSLNSTYTACAYVSATLSGCCSVRVAQRVRILYPRERRVERIVRVSPFRARGPPEEHSLLALTLLLRAHRCFSLISLSNYDLSIDCIHSYYSV